MLQYTKLHEGKKILALNSFYKKLITIPTNVFIFHSNCNVEKEKRKLFKLDINKLENEGRLLYLFYILNYELYNESNKFQSFRINNERLDNFTHFFKSIIESRKKNKIDTQSPFIIMEPVNVNVIPQSLLKHIRNGNRYDIRKDTNVLFSYVREKLKKNEPFVIPRIAGIENQLSVNIAILSNGTYLNIMKNRDFPRWVQSFVLIMKKNAGVKITTVESALKYAKLYAQVFSQCELYTDWPSWGAVGQALGNSQLYWENKYHKPTLWAFVYDIYHNIFGQPWTHALKGKRVLIISAFVESYKKKVEAGVLDKIYGIDLFPECELLFLKPPQTQGANSSEEFDVELERFAKRIEAIKEQFDVALCSCGGYGNLICAKIFEMGKSSIYVGGVLQMYFGVLGQRWLRERPSIVRLFLNKDWSRPQDSEKPKDFKKVEGSCYW